MAAFKPYQREDGKWDWRLFASNGEQVAESHQGYRDEFDAYRAIRSTIIAVQEATLAAYDMKATQATDEPKLEGT